MYRERETSLSGVVLWTQDAGSAPAPRRILPDGCMDLIWDGTRLLIAGPDSRTRWHLSAPDAVYVGLRFAEGIGPAVLGTTADEVLDRSPDLDAVWSSSASRGLTDRVARAPEAALERWLENCAARQEMPELGRAIFSLAAGGSPPGVIAAQVGIGARQLHRRCLELFGYGPRHLARVLRFQRALGAGRAGQPLAQIAAIAGFADQAHLSREVRDLVDTTPARLFAELSGQDREQVDRRAVRIVHHGVTHPPEGVPGRDVSFVARAGEVQPGGVHRLGRAAVEGEGDPVTPHRSGPARVEGPDDVLGVEGEPQAAKGDVHMRFPVGVGGDLEAHAPVERKGRSHVRHDEFDERRFELHVDGRYSWSTAPVLNESDTRGPRPAYRCDQLARDRPPMIPLGRLRLTTEPPEHTAEQGASAMTIREASPAGAPCWVDLWTTDVEGSRSFYSGLFGWEALEPSPEFGGYWMFTRDGSPIAGGMGSMGEMTANNTWKPFFCTRDIDASLELAVDSGAEIHAGAMPVADLGVQAVLGDPAGAVFGLWQPGSFEGFRVIGEPSSPSWFELHTREHAKEVAFYRNLFDYEVGSVGDTDEFRYSTFRPRGSEEDLGGVMDSSRWLSDGADHWDVYWHVDDAAASAERVTEIGGAVLQGPEHTPYGVLVGCADPAGAQFKLRASA